MPIAAHFHLVSSKQLQVNILFSALFIHNCNKKDKKI